MINKIFKYLNKSKRKEILRISGGILFGILLLLSPWYLPAILDWFLYIVGCLPPLIAIVILGVIALVYPIWALVVMTVSPANIGGNAVNKSMKELFGKDNKKSN